MFRKALSSLSTIARSTNTLSTSLLLRRTFVTYTSRTTPTQSAVTLTPLQRHQHARNYASTCDTSIETQAQIALEKGTSALLNGHLEAALDHYKQSIAIKETSIAFYNLGVVQSQLGSLPEAIISFEKSLSLAPTIATTPPPLVDAEFPESSSSSETLPNESTSPPTPTPLTPAQLIVADIHTNLGAAYILSKPPNPTLALIHLQKALSFTPEDGQVCYNLAAVLETMGEWEEALVAFKRSENLGIQRAKINIRNLGAKILGKIRAEEEEKEKEEKEKVKA